jgi:hypothetical protein
VAIKEVLEGSTILDTSYGLLSNILQVLIAILFRAAIRPIPFGLSG